MSAEPLDLEAIKARAEKAAEIRGTIDAIRARSAHAVVPLLTTLAARELDSLSAGDVPALIAEVESLREEAAHWLAVVNLLMPYKDLLTDAVQIMDDWHGLSKDALVEYLSEASWDVDDVPEGTWLHRDLVARYAYIEAHQAARQAARAAAQAEGNGS